MKRGKLGLAPTRPAVCARRLGMFGPELPARPATPAHRRLLAFLGATSHPTGNLGRITRWHRIE
ncbi:hypothetical protein [Nonomuraea basaltis]|uniref:hypothetical protein n=1 Tax=Nonomuraea basaltis TaxID=2495887 RepID=UPI00110C3FE5|nr:hypothetical protein [Nonomuraea basaltis]TMR99749.1 hypothetical protein EJK15_05620 [Nonomuraea basaltis]